jgi:hypothetical protein
MARNIDEKARDSHPFAMARLLVRSLPSPLIIYVINYVNKNVYISVCHNIIMDTEVISIRVKRGTMEQLKKAGINPKDYIEDMAWKANAKKVLLELKEIVKTSKPSKAGFAVKSIREDRNETH